MKLNVINKYNSTDMTEDDITDLARECFMVMASIGAAKCYYDGLGIACMNFIDTGLLVYTYVDFNSSYISLCQLNGAELVRFE